MPEPFVPGPNPSLMDYLVHVWNTHRAAFDALLSQPIPELKTEVKIIAGEPEELSVNLDDVGKAIARRHGRELLAHNCLCSLATNLDAIEETFAVARAIVPLEPALAERLRARQDMLCAFELRYLAGLIWKTEYSLEWQAWRCHANPDKVYEGDFGRYEPIPKWLLKIYDDVGCDDMHAVNAENILRERILAALALSPIDDGEKAKIIQELATNLHYADGLRDGFSNAYLAGVEAGRTAAAANQRPRPPPKKDTQ